MAYAQSQLNAAESILQSYSALNAVDFFIMQHALPDTEKFIDMLHRNGNRVAAFVAKPLSADAATLDRIRAKKVRTILKSYAELEEGFLLDVEIRRAARAAKKRGRKLAIIDVGGYMIPAASRITVDDAKDIVGIVEVTTFGHNRYNNALDVLRIPIASLARSPLKFAEAFIVGDSAVTALDVILRSLGVMLQGKLAGMIGFGAIGEPTAEALRAKGMNVTVYDSDPKQLLRARLKGFQVALEKHDLIASADFILSSTGTRTISNTDFLAMRDNVTLASVGSKGNEFDVAGLTAIAARSEILSEMVTAYTLPNGRCIHLVRDGKAVNFHIQSCPDEAMDVVFAEQVACTNHLLGHRELGMVHLVPDEVHRKIAKLWLSKDKVELSRDEPGKAA